ncbi:hypothetical protein [Candidatus Poriferisocius sp.]|uniref:hypothetical protein n=1 Tax=Candidatus Poriferisocius sp. TaxID=3101276 RepID=UPI003B5CAE70
MNRKEALSDAVAGVWQAFDRAAATTARVAPSAPVLFFGDAVAYDRSPLRVVTVALNPSWREFPAGDPFCRFPLAEGIAAEDQDRYLDAMSAYFLTSPYWTWFQHLDPLLNGMGSGYRPGRPSTALHTDICSPVATDPTWSRLDDGDRQLLQADGVPLWHGLMEALRPHIVVLAMARGHLSDIAFAPVDADWGDLHIVDTKVGGNPREPPYRVQARRYAVGGSKALFVLCPAMRSPLPIGTAQKNELGAIILDGLANVR